MTKKIRIGILIVLTILVAFALVQLSIGLHTEVKRIKLPNRENRLVGNMSTYKWITVKKLSRRFNISEEDIFKDFGIISQNGDENISIDKLAKKYNKTLLEIKTDLRKIIGNKKK